VIFSVCVYVHTLQYLWILLRNMQSDHPPDPSIFRHQRRAASVKTGRGLPFRIQYLGISCNQLQLAMISYHQLFRHERSWAMRRCCFRNQPHLLNRWSTIPTWTTWWCQKIWNPSPSDDHSFSHCLMVIQSGIPEKINDWSLKETHSNVDSMFKIDKNCWS